MNVFWLQLENFENFADSLCMNKPYFYFGQNVSKTHRRGSKRLEKVNTRYNSTWPTVVSIIALCTLFKFLVTTPLNLGGLREFFSGGSDTKSSLNKNAANDMGLITTTLNCIVSMLVHDETRRVETKFLRVDAVDELRTINAVKRKKKRFYTDSRHDNHKSDYLKKTISLIGF